MTPTVSRIVLSRAGSAALSVSGPARAPRPPAVSAARRFDFVAPHTYTGIAPLGSGEGEAAWLIRRSTYDSSGSLTGTASASGVAWDDRLTETYT